MDTHKFFVEKMRFHLKDADTIVFVGWFFDGSTKGHTLMVSLDDSPLAAEIKINSGAWVRQKYLRSINEINEEVVGAVKLPKNWKQGRVLRIQSVFEEEKRTDYTISVKKLCKLQREIEYYIENCHREEGKVTVSGWCMAQKAPEFKLLDKAGKPLSVKWEDYTRKDLLSVFPECDRSIRPGFLLEGKIPEETKGTKYSLLIKSGEKEQKIPLKKWDNGTVFQFVTEKAGDTVRYFKRNGWSATIHKINSKLRKKEASSYDAWRKKYEIGPEELERQRAEIFSYRPVFSIVVPLYRTNPQFLKELIASVSNQTYPNWQLCLADGSGDADRSGSLTPILASYAAWDARIRFCTLERNEGISGNTNAALKLAEGDFIVLADHDDLLPANALYEFAKALNEDSSIEVLYSDEDKISMDGNQHFEPHFKPDFNIDLLCSINYICHLFAVKKEVQKRAGLFRSEYDGAQDLDFILRCAEQAENIRHIDKILYHWRCHMGSTAANPESKLYAYEAGRKAIEAHYRRLSIPARVVNAGVYGMYRTIYEWKEEPLVSIIIPNKDHARDLAKCVNSVFEKSDYRNFEFIIVENNSVEQETFHYYNKLEAEHENVKVIYYEGSFNYSKINNFGAKAANGEYFLLLNNDTEMIHADCIRELLGYCMREDVGVTGAKLLYGDGTIQHAGVVVGFGGTAGHAFLGKARYDTGYFGRLACAQDYSAVTAACLMVKRSVYEQAGGLTEELAVAFNDVDFCLKVRQLGKLVVYNPYAELYHYESKSRGYEDSPEKVERFNNEVDILLQRWRNIVENGDPYYNRNLTLDNSDFSLRK